MGTRSRHHGMMRYELLDVQLKTELWLEKYAHEEKCGTERD